MFELVQVGPKSYYINSPAKIGIYEQTREAVYLIDSGNDKDAGRRVRKILDERGWRLKGIVNTHSNADHIGGNQYLQKQFGCDIFAFGMEADFTRHPILEPSFLYGGYPFQELRHKFLLAAESDVKEVADEAFPKELEIIPLPGHFFDMIGIRTPDDTVFLADCLSSAATLEKYKVTFIYDVARYLETLTMLESLQANMFVPAHTEATNDLAHLIEANRDAVLEIADVVLDLCKEPAAFEAILRGVFAGYGLTMTAEQYVLVGSTIRSYLAWLKDSGKLEIQFADHYMLWHAVS